VGELPSTIKYGAVIFVMVKCVGSRARALAAAQSVRIAMRFFISRGLIGSLYLKRYQRQR